jgi:hypothetical protein
MLVMTAQGFKIRTFLVLISHKIQLTNVENSSTIKIKQTINFFTHFILTSHGFCEFIFILHEN